MNAIPPTDSGADLSLLRATLRINTIIFAGILGALTGLLLLALAIVAMVAPQTHAGLLVVLLGVFLPGYDADVAGAMAGLAWGSVAGAALGGAVYWVQTRNALERLGDLIALEAGRAEFPAATLRLHGPSLGLAVGLVGAMGIIGATSWLVLRGTAAKSTHAQLLSEIFPGYRVDLIGAWIGGVELFVALYVFCMAFAYTYNRVAAVRSARH